MRELGSVRVYLSIETVLYENEMYFRKHVEFLFQMAGSLP